MVRSLLLLVLVRSLAACSGSPPAKSGEGAKASSAEAKPPAVAPPAKAASDPVLVKICKAFDAAVAQDEGDTQVLTRAAVLATERGVSEAQLAELGALPPQLLASIRKRGAPSECDAMMRYLETVQ